MRGFSRVLAYPQMLEGQQATRVEGHQHFSPFHDVQAEWSGTEDNTLGLHAKGQHYPVLVLRQERHAVVKTGREGGVIM